MEGTVYEQTSAGRRPVVGAVVFLDGLAGMGLEIAFTATDEDGHYVLCGIPSMPWLTVDVSAEGFQPYELNGIASNLDVELHRKEPSTAVGG